MCFWVIQLLSIHEYSYSHCNQKIIVNLHPSLNTASPGQSQKRLSGEDYYFSWNLIYHYRFQVIGRHCYQKNFIQVVNPDHDLVFTGG